MAEPLDDLFTFLRFPSISTDPERAGDVRACAEWLVAKTEAMGLQTTLHETPKHPIVSARNEHIEGRPTVMIYGHYDVQPVDPVELWDSAPFEPEIREGKIWCRGATDNKGQMLSHLLGVEQTLAEKGELPVNLILVFEGEEEIGSPNLGPFLEAHKEEFACDVIAVSDTGMVAAGTPTMGYGLRGITCCDVIVHGPSADMHSGCYGGAVANPCTALSKIVASFHDDEGRIAVAGFYDDVRPLEDWEREMWSTVPGMDEAEMLRLTGACDLHGESGYSSAERLWARPTLELNGIGGGYQGEGSKTVLPARAFAKISCRLVPDQDPDDIAAKLKAHVEANVPAGVTVEVVPGHDGRPYIADPHSKYGKAGQEALRRAFDKEPVLIREGGSIPIVESFRQILGADTLLLGLALPDCQIHAPNENFPVENFHAGIRLNKVLLEQLGQS